MIRLVALAGAITISFSAILVRLADASPSTVAFFRCGYGLMALALLALAGGAGGRPRRERLGAFGAGMLMGLSLTLWNYAIGYIGAGLSTVIANTQVVFVGLAAWALYGERPSRLALGAVPAVLLGVVLASGLGRIGAYGEAPVLGAALMLLNALVYATFLLLFRRYSGRAPAPRGPLLDATAGATVLTLAAGLLTDPGFTLRPSWPTHGWLLLLGLGPQVVGWLLILRALPRLPALDTSVILLMQPVLTTVWAFLLFRELPSALQWSGVALVLAGVTLLSARGSARPDVPTMKVSANPAHTRAKADGLE